MASPGAARGVFIRMAASIHAPGPCARRWWSRL